MWFVGYLCFVLAFGFTLHWAAHVQTRYKRWKAISLVAMFALPTAWAGQVLLIPFGRDGRIDPKYLLPNLAIAGYSVGTGLVSAWLLSKNHGRRRASYIAYFALLHALMILAGGWLAVGLSKRS
jgi:hypothetical protein